MKYLKSTTFLILLFSVLSFSEIKIGVLLPLTGPYASYGSTAKKGIELAFSQKNSVKGEKVSLIFLDTKGDLETTKNVAVRLIEREKVVAIIGEILSENTVVLSQICEQYGVPLITGVSNTDVTKGKKYANRISYDNYSQGVLVAEFLFATMKIRNLAILSDTSLHGKELSQHLFEHFQRIGGKVYNIDYDPQKRVFTEYIVKVFESNPDAIFLASYYSSAIRLIQDFKVFGFDGFFVSSNYIEVPEIFSSTYDELLYVSVFNRWSTEARTKSFLTDFQKRYNEIPTAFSALYYDAYMLILNVFEKFKVNNSKDLAQALRKTKDYKGVTGNITIDSSGERTMPVTFVKIESGLPKFMGISSHKLVK